MIEKAATVMKTAERDLIVQLAGHDMLKAKRGAASLLSIGCPLHS
jgi:hypothetical protein